jgi:chromosome transmission fidelity protein 18
LTAEKFTFQDGCGGSWMNQLVTSTGGDIRSCLFTLQFASSRAKVLAAEKEIVSSSDANHMHDGVTVDITQTLRNILYGEGMKDERNDITGTINCIFRKEKETTKISRKKIAKTSTERSLEKVLDAVQVSCLTIP